MSGVNSVIGIFEIREAAAMINPGDDQIKHLVVLASKWLDTLIIFIGVSKDLICIILQYFAKNLKNLLN